jgi:hypothetical protein
VTWEIGLIAFAAIVIIAVVLYVRGGTRIVKPTKDPVPDLDPEARGEEQGADPVEREQMDPS